MTADKNQDALSNCPFCGDTVQRTDHLDSDDKITDSTVRCKPCNYTMPLKKFQKRTATSAGVDVSEHVAWARYYQQNGVTKISLCDSDSGGAFKVYRSSDERYMEYAEDRFTDGQFNGFAKCANQIESIIAEFGDKPENALAIIGEYLGIEMHHQNQKGKTSIPDMREAWWPIEWEKLYNIINAKYSSATLISDRVELWLYRNDPRKTGNEPPKGEKS